MKVYYYKATNETWRIGNTRFINFMQPPQLSIQKTKGWPADAMPATENQIKQLIRTIFTVERITIESSVVGYEMPKGTYIT